jgi:hypothetical protein
MASDPLLPCLKEHNWQGRAQTVCRPLWSQDSAYMPWLAFGYDHPHTFEFIGKNKLADLNTTAEALEAQALANLRARPVSWQPLDVNVPNATELRMLLAMDDFLVAERIADRDFMQQAHGTLNAPALLVGIPRRGMLMVTRADQNATMVNAFGALVAGQFSEAETAPISPMLFAMQDGNIVGVVEAVATAMAASGGATDGGEDAGQETEAPAAPYISALVTRNENGTEDVHLMAGGTDGERLASAIEGAFTGLLQEHASRKEFSGHIAIVILAMTPRSERKHIPKLLEHLRGLCAELSRGENRYRVSLTYQRDDGALGAAAAPGSIAAPAAAAAAPGGADVFMNPKGMFDRLVLLTADSIIVANPDESTLTQAAAAGANADWQTVIGMKPTVVPYAMVSKVSTNKHGDTINVRHKDKSGSRLTSISMKDAAARDQAWDGLRRRLGSGFTFTDVQYGKARAALAPIVTIAFCMLLTWLFYMAAQELASGEEAEVRGRNQAFKWIAVMVANVLGPTGVMIVGGIATLIALVWGSARIKTPPRMLTLARS